MKRRKKLLFAFVLAAVIALTAGITVMAVSTYGTSTDPLITLSYLTNVFKPSVLADVDKAVASGSQTFQNQLDAKISNLQAAAAGSSTKDDFVILTLSNGQTVTCSVGTEIMLRIGSAKAAGPDYPALIDSTTAGSVSSGTGLTTNHMYVVTIKGNGITATSGTTKVLIRGSYTVS